MLDVIRIDLIAWHEITGQLSVVQILKTCFAPRLMMLADVYLDNWTKRQAPSTAAIQAVCLFVQHCHFAAPGKIAALRPRPRSYGTIYGLRTI
jgi:hypothetical protein